MKLQLFIILMIVLLLNNNIYAQEKKKEEPPPPPIPFSEVYTKEIQPNQQVQQKTEEITDMLEIPEYIFRDYIEKRDRLLPYLRDYKNLQIQPFKQQYLSMTNVFYYTPSVPVLIQLPFKIKHVIMANPGASSITGQQQGQQQGGQQGGGQGGNVHSVYDDRYLIVFPPPPSTDIWSFVVVSEGDQPYYFFGERATTTMTKGKHVIPFISYTYQPNYDERKLILTYFQQYKKCPYNGETINVNGKLYRFLIKDTNMLASDNYIYFCNRMYEIVKVQ